MSTQVKVFQSTDSGAPSLSGTAGSLITLLDSCLTVGYGSVSLDSVVIAGNVVTCTKSTGHGLVALGSVGPVIRMSGVSVPSELNADWRTTIVSATQFTFQTSGIADQTATGTITAKRAPLGFSKAFTGTNKAVYRADNIESTRLYLRVADDGVGSASYARVRGYETMTDVDSGTGPFPTDTLQSGGSYFHKSSVASSTVRKWRLIGDDRAFYLLSDVDGSGYYTSCWFGDIVSAINTDGYHCGLIGALVSYGDNGLLNMNVSTVNRIMAASLARSYTQTGAAVSMYRSAHRLAGNTYIGNGGLVSYPNPVGGGLLASPLDVNESEGVIRGVMPGAYAPLHNNQPPDNTVVESMSGIAGHALWCVRVSGNGIIALDISGPWR